MAALNKGSHDDTTEEEETQSGARAAAEEPQPFASLPITNDERKEMLEDSSNMCVYLLDVVITCSQGSTDSTKDVRSHSLPATYSTIDQWKRLGGGAEKTP